jgi:Ca2+-binding EF-hand superfamily protein
MSRKIPTDYTPDELNKAFRLFHTKDVEDGFVKTEVLERAMTTYGKISVEEAAKLLAAVSDETELMIFIRSILIILGKLIIWII